VLVLLIPQARLAVSARYLAAHYTGFRAYRFPDPEFAAFRQMVLLASKKPQATADAAAQAQLEALSAVDLPPLADVPAGPPTVVPTLPRAEVLFAPLAFDPVLAAQEARRRGVWAQAAFAEQLWPPDERPVRPLMPLRRGHLALLIAAGLLNNVVLRLGGRRVLVKGRSCKELVQVDSDDEHTVPPPVTFSLRECGRMVARSAIGYTTSSGSSPQRVLHRSLSPSSVDLTVGPQAARQIVRCVQGTCQVRGGLG
jgi:hypothetical protein